MSLLVWAVVVTIVAVIAVNLPEFVAPTSSSTKNYPVSEDTGRAVGHEHTNYEVVGTEWLMDRRYVETGYRDERLYEIRKCVSCGEVYEWPKEYRGGLMPLYHYRRVDDDGDVVSKSKFTKKGASRGLNGASLGDVWG